MARPVLVGWLVAAVLVTVSCTRPGVTAASAPVVVTRHNGALPTSCTPAGAARLLDRFFVAIDQGDRAQLAHLLASARAISSGPNDPTPASSPTILEGPAAALGYFAQRQQHHEQLHLLEIALSPNGGQQTGFGFTATWSADDLPPGPTGGPRLASGKGGLDCAAQQILVWSLTMASPTAPPAPLGRCPRPAGLAPSTIVACTA